MIRPEDALARQLRRAGVAPARIAAEVARQAGDVVHLPTTAAVVAIGMPEDPRFRGMNKTERRFAERLDLRCHAGEVLWWAFEGWKFRLGNDSFWTPDFAAMLADRTLVVYDVKGRKGDRYWAEEHTLVKIRAVAARYPVRVAITWPLAGDRLSGWGEDWFS